MSRLKILSTFRFARFFRDLFCRIFCIDCFLFLTHGRFKGIEPCPIQFQIEKNRLGEFEKSDSAPRIDRWDEHPDSAQPSLDSMACELTADRNRLRRLAKCWIAWGILTGLLTGIGGIYLLLNQVSQSIWSNEGYLGPGPDTTLQPGLFLATCIMACYSIAAFFVAYNIISLKSFKICNIIAAFTASLFPIGTLLALLTLRTFQRESVRQFFIKIAQPNPVVHKNSVLDSGQLPGPQEGNKTEGTGNAQADEQR